MFPVRIYAAELSEYISMRSIRYPVLLIDRIPPLEALRLRVDLLRD